MAGRRLAVAVVQGGPSSEAEVSRASAAAVAKALIEAGHSVVRFELDAFLAESLRTGGFDVVFPAVHGAVGEDGSLQGLLEVLDQPYVGSGVVASALAMHKRIARVLFAAAGLPVAKGVTLARAEFGGDAVAAARRARESVGARVVVKPSSHGSAIGVARIDDAASEHDVASAIDAVWAIDDFALAEHFVRGREVTCGVMDLGETRALPVTEITAPGDAFYTFDARYAPGRSVHQCPAKLPPDVAAQVQDVAVRAHRALGCRDLSRVDFVVGDDAAPGALTLLEVNTLPGMTPTSLYPEAAAASGTSMVQLCDAMVLHAHARGPSTRVDARPLPH